MLVSDVGVRRFVRYDDSTARLRRTCLAGHQRLQREVSGLHPDPEQRVEAHSIVPPPVPPENELVEIRLQIALAKAVVDAERVALEVREHAMNPRHQDVRVDPTDVGRDVLTVGEIGVGRVPVSPDHGAGLGRIDDEAVKRFAAIIPYRGEPDTRGNVTFAKFDRADDRDLADGAAALTASNGLVLGAIGDDRLVDLDDACERIAIRRDHRLAETMQQEPRALVGANTEFGLQLER